MEFSFTFYNEYGGKTLWALNSKNINFNKSHCLYFMHLNTFL
jgi:hypothetical protein